MAKEKCPDCGEVHPDRISVFLPNDKGGFQAFLKAQASIWAPEDDKRRSVREAILMLQSITGSSLSMIMVYPLIEYPGYGGLMLDVEVDHAKVN